MQRAVFIDALGTMLRLDPPWERIDPACVTGIPPERVREGFLAEMHYYRAHAERGFDPDSLAELRVRCAEVLSRELGREIEVGAMMDAIRFQAFGDTLPALRELRAAGLKLVCVSNWDCSLETVLEGLGIGALLDGVVSSAVVGARKPDPSIFEVALRIAGCGAGSALHVGDSDADVVGARRAGIEALRIDRQGGGDIASLSEISDHLALSA